MKIFLICPVRDPDKDTTIAVYEYVADLEAKGHQIYWPTRDTKQNDPSGGYQVCRMNFTAILEADEIHIWYDEKSNGSKFDMGGVFMLIEMLGYNKKIVIVNREEAEALDINNRKSFLKVMKHLID